MTISCSKHGEFWGLKKCPLCNNIDQIMQLFQKHVDLHPALPLDKNVVKYFICKHLNNFDNLSDDERLQIFNKYCKNCGSKNPKCDCCDGE